MIRYWNGFERLNATNNNGIINSKHANSIFRFERVYIGQLMAYAGTWNPPRWLASWDFKTSDDYDKQNNICSRGYWWITNAYPFYRSPRFFLDTLPCLIAARSLKACILSDTLPEALPGGQKSGNVNSIEQHGYKSCMYAEVMHTFGYVWGGKLLLHRWLHSSVTLVLSSARLHRRKAPIAKQRRTRTIAIAIKTQAVSFLFVITWLGPPSMLHPSAQATKCVRR